MLLTLASNAAYARTSVSQADIGTATTLGRKLRFTGAVLQSVASTGTQFAVIGAEATNIRLTVVGQLAGGNIALGLSGQGSANPAPVTISIPAASINASELYTLRVWAGPGGCGLNLRDGAGAQIASNTAAGTALAQSGPGNGMVHWGAFGSTFPGAAGAWDGDAVYDRAPPDNIDAPRADDPGILWGVLDDGGNIVPGATELDTLSGATWGPGGDWDRPEPAPTYSGALSAAAQPATASIAGAHAAPVPIGALAAAAGAALVAFSGAYAPPAGGTLSAQAQAATASISGAYEAPITGALSAAAGAATASLAGAFEYPEPRWAVLGDSNSDEYNADDNRPAHNWTEMLAAPSPGAPALEHHRGLDLGTWGTRSEPRRRGYANNYARSGATMVDVVASQLTLVEARVANGEITHVVMFGTGNEWGNPFQDFYIDRIYNSPDGGVTDSQGANIDGLMNAVAGRYTTVMDTIVGAGLIGGMVVVMPPRWDIFPVLLLNYTNPTRLGYVGAAVEHCNGLIEAHAASVNAAAGRTVVATTTLDALWREAYATDDGTHITIAGVPLIYTSDALNGEPNYFAIAPQTAIPHPGTIAQGALANTVIAAANQLPGVQVEPFSDREIRENAGIFADEVTGALSATAQPATASIAGAHAAPVYAGAIAATADPASAQLTGAHTAPTYAGELSATAQAASSAITGSHTAPTYAGALGASAGAATASLSGTHAAPQEDGALRAAAQPATASIAGSYAAPVHVGQLVALAAPAAAQIAGAYAVPAGGTLRAAAQRATAVVTGSYAAPGAVGTLAAAAQPATAQVAGTHSAPVWAGSVVAAAEQASAAIAGRYAAPGVIVGRLRAAAAPASAHIEAEYTYSGVVHPVRATLSVSSIRPTLTVMDA